MKSWKLFTLLSLVIVTLTFGLRTTKEQAERGSAAGPLKFGVMAPLTGDFANYGKLIKDGVELARSDLLAGGIDAQVIYEDACLPAEAVTAAKKLLMGDKINALVSNYCLVALGAVGPLFEAAHVPLLQTDLVPDGMLREGGYVLTTNSLVRPEAEQLAELAFREYGARRAGILYLTTQWGEGFKSAFAERFTALGGEIVAAETTPIGMNDFRPELTRIKGRRPDVIFIAHLGSSLGNALKQIRQLGLKQRILVPDSAEEQGVLDVAGEAAEGIEFLSPDVTAGLPESEVFSERFQKRFGYAPSVLTRNAYDATVLAAHSLTKCGRESGCARGALASTRNYQGASGVFSMREAGGAERAFVRKRVINGKFLSTLG